MNGINCLGRPNYVSLLLHLQFAWGQAWLLTRSSVITNIFQVTILKPTRLIMEGKLIIRYVAMHNWYQITIGNQMCIMFTERDRIPALSPTFFSSQCLLCKCTRVAKHLNTIETEILSVPRSCRETLNRLAKHLISVTIFHRVYRIIVFLI